MKILVTGCCGFIGYHLILKLLVSNKTNVFGIDNMNDYYDTQLKLDRLKILKVNKKFSFKKADICNANKIDHIFKANKFDYVIHLAAQAGVRHSIKNPKVYLKTNVNGFFNILDLCKNHRVKHLVYASTSSVYGDNKSFPLKEEFNTDKPESFYAATKKTNEVLAYSYSSIYRLPTTGLRFFTVYGPYGRPDMALYKFTQNIFKGKKIDMYNYGNHHRDFTYVDDVVGYISSIIKKPSIRKIPYQIFNIGSDDPKSLKYFVKVIEKVLQITSKQKLLPFQKGDVLKTHADISKIRRATKLQPKFNIEKGIKKFVTWYINYYKVNKKSKK